MKEPLKQVISQTLRNQQEDGIRNLYVYSQILLCISSNDAVYGNNDTKPNFFSKWIEKFNNEKEEAEYKDKLKQIKNNPLTSN